MLCTFEEELLPAGDVNEVLDVLGHLNDVLKLGAVSADAWLGFGGR